jgi:hypothetical protein
VTRGKPIAVLVLALSFAVAAICASTGTAKPITKQNGSQSVLTFTSICSVNGYASYGFCGGDATTYTNVVGRMNAVQAKQGRYNLDFSFTNLTPGTTYRLWGNDGSWFSIATAVADEGGAAKFSYQTTSPVGLGFDLNFDDPNITIVTSYWSGQLLGLNPDGSLSAGA